MDMRKLVGRNFGRLRREKGFTQEQFAEMSVLHATICQWARAGRRNPTVVTLFHLANALGVSHIDLVRPNDGARSERTTLQKRKG